MPVPHLVGVRIMLRLPIKHFFAECSIGGIKLREMLKSKKKTKGKEK